MNITLYYVPGINETDTPVFDTLAHQSAFFDACSKDVISSGFYPPFLRNTIKLDVTDYNLITSVWNYLSIEYTSGNKTKRFYYFIDRKRYVNEYILEVDIVMDTIQTYMFDAQWIHSHIVRKTIKRWISPVSPDTTYKINRDYIRENFSSELFNNVYRKNIVNNDFSQWVFIARKFTREWDSGSVIDFTLPSFNFQYKVSGKFYLQPFYSGKCIWHDTPSTPSQTTTTDVYVDTYFAGVLGEANVLEAYLIPFNPLSGLVIRSGATSYEYECAATGIQSGYDYASFTCFGLGTATTYYQIQCGNTQYLNLKQDTVTLPFARNSATNTLFSWIYVPALIDENYIVFDFGTYNTRSVYPLQVAKTVSMICNYWADPSSGIMYFQTVNSTETIKDNKYDTIVSTKTPLSIELRNAAWAEYIARNRATLAGSLLNSVKTNASFALGDYLNQPLSVGGVVSKDLDKDIEKRSWSEIDRISSGTRKNRGISMSASGGGLIDYGVNAVNKLMAPTTVKTSGTYNEDALGYNAYIYDQIILCSNITEAAYIYESTGYKVSEESTGNLFETNNRYYYDCVQTEDMNIELGAMDIERDFIARWNAGLRLWHTTNGVLNCKIGTALGFDMGQVCIYDNVEV